MAISHKTGALGAVVTCLAVLIPVGASSGGAFAADAVSTTETSYIIQVPEGQTDALLNELADLGTAPDAVYDNALNGVAVSLTPSELGDVKSTIVGETIEADRPVELMSTQSSAPWNLSMLDYSGRPVDPTYAYPSTAGSGVRVYVLDTGIAASPEFGARLLPGVNFVTDQASTNTNDCYGHGTHVAGTIAGTTYGVAKSALLVPIRLFNCGGGGATTSMIVSGIDWEIANKPAGTVGVINMSLGAPCRSSLPCRATDPFLVAVQKAIDAGFVVAVAAGNSSQDACSMTPAAAPNALTVGAVDKNDAEASFSNFGSCVDLYAPGVDIPSVNYVSPTTSALMSGTSMASPHVAGAAAVYISANPSASATQVATAIKDGSAPNMVAHYAFHTGTTSELSLASFPGGAAVGVPATAPAALSVTSTDLTSIGLSWQRSLSSSPITNYVVSYRLAGTTSWTTWDRPAALDLTTTVTGLTPGKTYELRVNSVTDVTSAASATVRATTLSGLPNTVTGLVASGLRAASAVVSWATSIAPGSSVTDYEVQFRKAGTVAWTAVTRSPSTVTSASVSALSPSTAYEVRVRGISPFGAGTWSTPLRLTSLTGVPSAVTSVTASATNPTSVNLTWSAPSGNGADIVDYVVEYKRSTALTWIISADGVSASPSASVSGLTPGAAYNFRVTAKTELAQGPVSATYNRTTLSGRPAQVTSLTVTPANSSAAVSWNPPVTNGGTISDYLVDYRLSTSTTWVRVSDGVSATPGATIGGLTPGATYYVRVSGVTQFGAGTSAVSATRILP